MTNIELAEKSGAMVDTDFGITIIAMDSDQLNAYTAAIRQQLIEEIKAMGKVEFSIDYGGNRVQLEQHLYSLEAIEK